MNKKALGALAILGLVVVVGLGVFLSQSKKDKNPEKTKSNNEITPTAQGALPVSKVCDILTLEVAETIFKGKATVTDNNSSNSCTYTSSTDKPGDLQIVTMLVTGTTALGARQSFEQARTMAYSDKTEVVTGLDADEAYYATTLHQLSILKGSNWIIITAYSSEYPTDKDASIATAKLVLGKIK